MGEDWLYWFIPTRPCLKINFLEKLYTVREIERTEKYEEDNYDEDKKIYA